MNLREEAISLLEKAGYAIRATGHAAFHFEDSSVLGVLSVYDSADEIADRWEEVQDSFLVEHDSALRSSPHKAWNVYSVHVTQAEASSKRVQDLKNIEEDLRRTRKIVGAGLASRSDLRQSLLPLLSIQRLVTLKREPDLDRLHQRIDPEGGPLSGLMGNLQAEEIARTLLETQ